LRRWHNHIYSIIFRITSG